ncbi:DUF1804 family protein [Pseudomonas aeruginosa]|uniref:DUF1804 family protein n=1 Tax=Pseudomonas aeruginosa TaxID=287 RepID=UPI0021A4B21B|nr:DUF1804 family protein [Pseudomonas aeruginosa]
MEVLQRLASFIRERFPQHAQAFAEVLEPFGEVIAKEKSAIPIDAAPCGHNHRAPRSMLKNRMDDTSRPCSSLRPRLEDGLDRLLIAVGTYVMQRFGALNLWLYAIHKSTRFRLVELVALFLLFPAFELSNFGFQLAMRRVSVV